MCERISGFRILAPKRKLGYLTSTASRGWEPARPMPERRSVWSYGDRPGRRKEASALRPCVVLCAEHEAPARRLPASSASCPSLGCALLWSQALDCGLQQGQSGLSLDCDGPVLSSQCGIPGAPIAGALLVAAASGLGSGASTWPPERWDVTGTPPWVRAACPWDPSCAD